MGTIDLSEDAKKYIDKCTLYTPLLEDLNLAINKLTEAGFDIECNIEIGTSLNQLK